MPTFIIWVDIKRPEIDAVFFVPNLQMIWPLNPILQKNLTSRNASEYKMFSPGPVFSVSF